MQVQSNARLYRVVAEHVLRSSIQQGFGVDCYVYRTSGYYAERP